ncbi:hypothetical protein [Weeksella virosa]|uniref:Uncharacterized protein n=1 Tax=Weeksella virosa (strain ATCC 43766 / DSM 16922 / JCM 21250 / CCUG 30538 / CDC 9751 / IAM 14551 / NBRC 16016 / NCTC 11634 / CL345/78) TaxID=865938 RepID=F0P1T3_WEEVC|nr:hypothetical protein [Weeksella virosa]ADX68730.1 hypothetical protein Weevi_2055 [Weeksella virosa DSM 16922]MDK7375105.1 hypothetical protein [Weeksella virosa]SUP55080.1 Uncharacterised protein [Weeksella virosa]VEH63599.1 Uncharacterised protein [Weeksella virosa]
MKIAYSKKRLLINAFLGFFWVLMGAIYLMTNVNFSWLSYLTIILGCLYIYLFVRDYYKKYIEVNENSLTVNTFPVKTILFKDLINVSYFAGEFTFKTDKTTIRINKNLLQKSQQVFFEEFFQNLKNRID